ncbi:MAG: VOC family protein [Proteobacteria bacterium]|nr:VOC family protein [Pseudomonadota bacterium]
MIAVPALAAAASVYRRLGFTLSPRGVHSAALGTENHTIMLREDYFELLSVIAPTDRNMRWRRAIAEGGGIAGMAMTTIDPPAANALWQEAGLAPDAPIKFSRPVARPDGTNLEARFEVVSLTDVPQIPVRIFVCSQPTRDAVWLPELLEHANGAAAIRRLTVACPDPDAAAIEWRRVLPAAAFASIATGVRIDAGRHFIDLERASISQAQAFGIDFAVANLGICRSVLAKGAVAFDMQDGRIVVAPDAACNVRIRFEGPP